MKVCSKLNQFIIKSNFGNQEIRKSNLQKNQNKQKAYFEIKISYLTFDV